MPQLKEYIIELLEKGYKPATIKEHLLKYGYNEDEVNHALYISKRPIRINAPVIIAVTAIIAILGIIGFYLLNPSSVKPAELLDISIEELSPEVDKGGKMSADIMLENAGAREKYDVNLKYEIFDSSNNRLTFKVEILAIENSKQKSIELDIPDNTPAGEYILQVTVRYNGQNAIAKSPFTIKGEQAMNNEKPTDESPPEEQECLSDCDDNDASTQDFCDATTSFECRHITEGICGDDVCGLSESELNCQEDCETKKIVSLWEKTQKIEEKAKSDSESAANECESVGTLRDNCLSKVGAASNNPDACNRIEEEETRDDCLSTVAYSAKSPPICENVSENKRDSCYIKFASENDFSVCDKLINPYLKDNCNIMKETR